MNTKDYNVIEDTDQKPITKRRRKSSTLVKSGILTTYGDQRLNR